MKFNCFILGVVLCGLGYNPVFSQNKQIDSIKKLADLSDRNDTIKIKNLFNLGGLFFIDHQYAEGLKVINQARELSEKIKFKQGEGLYLSSMVIFHSYSRMQAVFKHLTNQYNANWNIEDIIQIIPSDTEPDFQLIKSRLFKALNSFDPVANKEALANIHAAIFYRFLAEQKLDSALLYGKIAEGYYDDLNKREEAFQIMLDKIYAYDNTNNKEALQNEESHAIDYLTNTTDKRTRAYQYEQMGFNYDRIRRYSSLIQCFLRSNEIWEELGDKKGQINASHQLGVYYTTLKEQENSLNYFLKELSIRKEINDSAGIEETYSSMTYTSIALGKLDDAEKYILLAKHIIEHTANPFRQARLLDAEGQLLKAKKMYPEAISKFKQSAELFDKIGLVVYLSYQYYYLAQCYQALGNLSESLRNAGHAFELAAQEDWADTKISASLLISELYAQLHNIPKAYKYLKLHKTIKDEWDSKDEISRAADFETQSLLNQHQHKIDLLEKNNLLAEARSKQESQRKNFAFAGIAVVFLAAGYSFYRYRRKKKLQSQQAVLSERLRISSELHDEVGATLSGIAMYSHLTKEQMRTGQTTEIEKSLNIMQQSSAQMVDKLNDIVWLINPDQDSLQKLVERLEEYARDMAALKNMQVNVSIPDKIAEISLPVDSRRNIYLFCKEAINNAVKYSNATLLELTVKEVNGKLEFSVSDNGKGFDAVMVRRGNGLENMQKRADEIGAKLILQSKLNEGAMVSMQCEIGR